MLAGFGNEHCHSTGTCPYLKDSAAEIMLEQFDLPSVESGSEFERSVVPVNHPSGIIITRSRHICAEKWLDWQSGNIPHGLVLTLAARNCTLPAASRTPRYTVDDLGTGPKFAKDIPRARQS